MNISESGWKCPICKQWDKAKNMVPATIKVSKRTWLGKAHLQCIQKYNKTHDTKYSVRMYNEDDKFLGKATPV